MKPKKKLSLRKKVHQQNFITLYAGEAPSIAGPIPMQGPCQSTCKGCSCFSKNKKG